jgi:hypothetical protein
VDRNRQLSPHLLQGTMGDHLRVLAEIFLDDPFQEAWVRPSNLVNRFATVIAESEHDHPVLTSN